MISNTLILPLRHDELTTPTFPAGTLLIPGVVYYPVVSLAQKELHQA